jgi:RNA polymerase sigma-70 factor (ECF subfamily)
MGRQEEFERVALVHSKALLRTAVRLTGEREAAEDLVQEALLRAWKAFDQFERGTNAKAWLFRILLNLSSRRWSQLQSLPPMEAIEESWKQPAVQPSALSHAELLAALEHLPQEFRVVLLLAVVEGFTCKEIGQMLAIPMGTVMSRLSRARKAMRKRLAETGRAAAAAAFKASAPQEPLAEKADRALERGGGLIQ